MRWVRYNSALWDTRARRPYIAERNRPPVIQTIFSAELPVAEHLLIQKNHIAGADEHGPRLAVVTGTHGDELEGQYVAFELARILQANLDKVHGSVDIYPAVNPLGINSIQRGVPLFDIDLNRTFPGDPQGSLTETFTAAIMDDIRGAACAVDIHASNIFLREMPQVRINELSAEELLPLAPLLNVDYVWVHASATVLESTLAYSLNSTGTPCLVVETGVGMRITPEYGHRLTQGVLRLAASLGIWRGGFERGPDPIVSRDGDVSYANAERAGVFLPKADHGSIVEKDQLIGIVADPLAGEVVQEVRAEQGGLLFTLREYPIVYPGSLLARILVGVTAADLPVFGAARSGGAQ